MIVTNLLDDSNKPVDHYERSWGVTYRLKSALKKAHSWTIMYNENYKYFLLNGPVKSADMTCLNRALDPLQYASAS